MACRNALASYLSGLRSRNSPCRWAERRHILRPKLLSGLESLTTSPTHSMVSHPTPTPSLPSFYSGCERHCRVCDDSELARRRLPPPLPPLRSRSSPSPVVRRRVLASRVLARSWGISYEWNAGAPFRLEKSGAGREGGRAFFGFSAAPGQLASFTAVRLPVERPVG